MKAADRSGARLALVLGDRELDERTIEIKDSPTATSTRCPSTPPSQRSAPASASDKRGTHACLVCV
ncbi:hypothetical protein SAMN04488550_2123 [Gordonia malaquae]|nr:hypothetical protein SAMN04488550_2123 [Gordonia malaquae]